MYNALREIRDFVASEALTILTAFALVVFLHDQVLEAYPVPTRSMEPTIEGHPTLGDRVLVDKTFDNRKTPLRFDMVVFWREVERKTVVKRVVGLPGEWIKIEVGDIFIGMAEEKLTRVQKLPGRDSDLVASLWDSEIESEYGRSWLLDRALVQREKDGALLLRAAKAGEKTLYQQRTGASSPGSPNWPLSFKRKISNAYLDGFDELQESGLMARDFGAEVWVRAQAGSSLWVELRYGTKSWLLSYRAEGTAQMWSLDGEGSLKPAVESTVERSVENTVPLLMPDESRHIVFMYLDGRFCLSIDGEDVLQVDVPPHELACRMNGLSLAAGKGTVWIDRLRIIHDFHYSSEGGLGWTPTRIPLGQYFVLGDNSQDSSDSRMTGPIRHEDLRGRPLMVVSPLKRFRIFKR